MSEPPIILKVQAQTELILSPSFNTTQRPWPKRAATSFSILKVVGIPFKHEKGNKKDFVLGKVVCLFNVLKLEEDSQQLQLLLTQIIKINI